MWLGADPGGRNNFGVACLAEDGSFSTALVSSAHEAADWFGDRGTALGVDSSLWWSFGQSSDRRADQWLRRTFKIGSGTVQTANSLQGSVLIQGPLLVAKMRETNPELPVTEAHPKALLLALKLGLDWQKISSYFGFAGDAPNSEHERDALLRAAAARRGFSGVWTLDLSADRHEEQDPSRIWIGPIHYWWPST